MNELLFALETSGDLCSAAILRDGKLVTEYTFRHEMHLSERLIEISERILHDANAELGDIKAFAAGIGPGSFTGTRIGVMTLKTWASVLNKPLTGISSLDALAAEYMGLQNTMSVPLLPCRSGIVYACPFDVSDEVPRPLAVPAALSFAELAVQIANLPAADLVFCGAAVPRYRMDIEAAFADLGRRLSFGNAEFPRALFIARLAERRFASGENHDDSLNLVPLYISPPPITLPKSGFPQGSLTVP